MRGDGRTAYVAVWATGALWLTVWFWVFSLAYSDSFFAYDHHSRLPVFAAALLGAGGIFASAAAQWRARRSIVAACLRHAVGVSVSLCPLLAVSALLSRADPPWRPSADDAMGTGIDFLLLTSVGVASLAVLAAGRALRKFVAPQGESHSEWNAVGSMTAAPNEGMHQTRRQERLLAPFRHGRGGHRQGEPI